MVLRSCDFEFKIDLEYAMGWAVFFSSYGIYLTLVSFLCQLRDIGGFAVDNEHFSSSLHVFWCLLSTTTAEGCCSHFSRLSCGFALHLRVQSRNRVAVWYQTRCSLHFAQKGMFKGILDVTNTLWRAVQLFYVAG
jgi:hypothetical protein